MNYDVNVNVNKKSIRGLIFLYIFCLKKYIDVVDFLINNKVNVNMCCENGNIFLYIFCCEGSDKIV